MLALGSVCVSFDALAWGTDGHRAVGAIADKLIKGTNAQKQVAALLQPGESLESVAIWPDCVKGNYCGPQTPEMVEYVAGNPKHSAYHYTDVPFQLDRYRDGMAGTADEDIVQTLKQAIAVLQGKTDPALNPHRFTKRQALILITHMTGDIHQPCTWAPPSSTRKASSWCRRATMTSTRRPFSIRAAATTCCWTIRRLPSRRPT